MSDVCMGLQIFLSDLAGSWGAQGSPSPFEMGRKDLGVFSGSGELLPEGQGRAEVDRGGWGGAPEPRAPSSPACSWLHLAPDSWLTLRNAARLTLWCVWNLHPSQHSSRFQTCPHGFILPPSKRGTWVKLVKRQTQTLSVSCKFPPGNKLAVPRGSFFIREDGAGTVSF